MKEAIPSSGDKDAGDFEENARKYLNALEREDFGPLFKKEMLLKDAREALLSHFDDMVKGEGGESLDDAIEILNMLMNDLCSRFDQLTEFSFEYFDYDSFVAYFVDRFTYDEKTRYERMARSVGKTEDDFEDLELTSTEDAKKLAQIYANAKLEERKEPDVDEHEYTAATPVGQMILEYHTNTSPKDALDWVKLKYRASVADAFNEFSDSMSPNIHDKARADKIIEEQAREWQESQKKEKIVSFLSHVAAASIGTGLAIGISHLTRKFHN